MRRSPFALGLSMLGIVAAGAGAGAAHASAAATNDALDKLEFFDTRRGKGQRNKRGKGAARRHGRKLRSNRLIVSKRVRRKHRRG